MTIYYTEEDFENYYEEYVMRDQDGRPVEDEEDFWNRMQQEYVE